MALKNGNVHRSSAIATSDLSLTISDIRVIANMVIIPMTVDGIVNKFAWKVLKLLQVK